MPDFFLHIICKKNKEYYRQQFGNKRTVTIMEIHIVK